jgi:hypothetical protein
MPVVGHLGRAVASLRGAELAGVRAGTDLRRTLVVSGGQTDLRAQRRTHTSGKNLGRHLRLLRQQAVAVNDCGSHVDELSVRRS